MMNFLELSSLGTAWSLAAVTLPGTLTLAALSGAAQRWLPQQRKCSFRRQGTLAIVIPAHNEEAGIGQLLKEINRQIGDDHSIEVWVVADNCTDRTAELAFQAGARVLVRTHDELRGKGYALSFGFEAIECLRHEWTLVVDADSVLDRDFIYHMRQAMRSDAHAIQARYTAIQVGASNSAVAGLGMVGMNVVRLKGRSALGASCGILGNGFALSRAVLDRLPYTAGSIVEDLEYHLNMVEMGLKVDYVDEAKIFGEIAQSTANLANQRGRWEGGRIRMIKTRLLPMLFSMFRQPGFAKLEAIGDLCLLPLSYQLLLSVSAALFSAITGHWFAALLAISFVPALAFHLHVILKQSDSDQSLSSLLMKLPSYLWFKLKMIPRVLKNSGVKARWVRTERETVPAQHSH